jgi:D-alanyl-D-alanine carboxypeptidase
MLAALVEAVSGQTYEEYVRARILVPLGMDRTDFVYTPRMREHEAAGSHPRDAVSFFVPIYIDMDRAVREKKDGTFWFNRVYSDQKGATGLIGSAEDLATFVKALMNGGRHGDVRILSDSSAAFMQRPVVKIAKSPAPDSGGMEFGLGWFLRREGEDVTLSHGGSGMGFVSMVQVSTARNTAVIVMANSTYLGRTMGIDLVNRMLELVGSRAVVRPQSLPFRAACPGPPRFRSSPPAG